MDGAIPTCDIQLLELGAVLDGNSQMLGTRALNVIDCGVIGWGGRSRLVTHGLWVRGYYGAPLTGQVNVGEVGAVWQHLAQCCDAPIANVVACGTVKGLDWKTLGFGFTLWYCDGCVTPWRVPPCALVPALSTAPISLRHARCVCVVTVAATAAAMSSLQSAMG